MPQHFLTLIAVNLSHDPNRLARLHIELSAAEVEAVELAQSPHTVLFVHKGNKGISLGKFLVLFHHFDGAQRPKLGKELAEIHILGRLVNVSNVQVRVLCKIRDVICLKEKRWLKPKNTLRKI